MKQGWQLLTLLAAGWISVVSAEAASGTWTNRNSGSWTNAANWNAGIIADGSGNTANFNTLSLLSDVAVTLDAARTIGSLSFDDLNATKHNWFLSPGSSGVLTLAGGSPAITVGGAVATINVSIAGTAGLNKTGAGRLNLNAANAYSGITTVTAGILGLAGATFSSTSPLVISAAGASVESTGTLNFSVNSTATTIAVTGSGTLRLVATTNGPTSPDLYFGPNHSGNSYWGARLAAALDLGGQQRYIFGKTGHDGIGVYGLTNADCQFGGTIVGSGGLTFIAQNNWTGSGTMETGFALNASNAFSGPVEIQRGSVYLGNASALTRTNVLTFNPATGNNARLFLYGNNAVVADLSSPGDGAAAIANGNLASGAAFSVGPVTLTVQQNNDTVFGGAITDTLLEYAGSGSGTTGPLNLVKRGPATLRLTGANSYSGTTTVSGGALEVDGSLAGSSLAVQAGGSLSGIGSINCPVTIQSGGNLAPGSSTVGALTILNTLDLSGNTRMRVAKAGMSLTSDQVGGATRVSYGGSLTVTNIGAWPLEAGDTFTLFTASTYTNAFTSFTLPPLGAALAWDTSNLVFNGSIAVINSTSAPVILHQPQGLTLNVGSPANFSVVAAGSRPLGYQWRKNGGNIAGATTSSYQLPATSTNDSGAYTVVVTNSFGSTTSVVANLNILPTGQSASVTNALVVYLNLDNNLAAQAGTTNGGTIYTGGATLGPRYVSGMIGSAATFTNASTAGQPNDWAVNLGNLEWIYANSFSLALWIRTSANSDGAILGNKDWTSGANVGWVISNFDPKNVNWNATGGTRRDIGLNPPFSDGNWHLITVTFNRTANQVISYVDGLPVNTSDISPSGAASFNAGFNTLLGSSGNGVYSGYADVDDLGLWTRVLSAQDVSGIYAAGLQHLPLTAAVPGVPPAITNQPVSATVASGGSVTFNVGTLGSGPFTYQWRFNGTNISGATNATLVLSSATPASQGVYTVLVSNGSGAILSSGAVLTVYELAVTGQWDFDRGDLRATVGSELEYVGNTADQTSFPFLNLNGQLAQVMAFGSNATSQGFYLRHGGRPNGGGHFVNQYTLILDVMFPAASSGQWRALFQSDPFNHDGNDAEFFVGNAATLPAGNGIGAENQYDGALAPNTWYRIAFAVDLAASPGQQLTKYVNGVPVGSQSLSGGVDGRFALGPTALLLTSGNPGFTQPGFVNSIQFVNGCLPAAAIANLGGPTADGLPPANGVLKIQSFSQNATMVNLVWTGPDGAGQLQESTNIAASAWRDVPGLGTNRNLTLPIVGEKVFYRIKQYRPDIVVGQLPDEQQSLPSKQILRAAGQQIQFGGRPVDLVLSPDGRAAYLKNIDSLVVVDVLTWRIIQTLAFPGSGASMHGVAVSPDGSHVYATGAGNELYDWSVATNGLLSFSRTIAMPGGSDPCGLALSSNGSKAYVCLSIANKLAVVDLAAGTVSQQISVGIAPWDVVLSPDGNTAYVSDWGGRFPTGGDLTAPSAGTQTVVDSRGVAASGAVSVVNLVSGLETAKVTAGLHPCDLELSADGTTLYVANANSDTVTIIDTPTRTVRETVLVRPDPSFPYGSASTGLAVSRDGKSLFVASGGNNAVAVVELPNAQHTNSLLRGFLPTDWYPGAVVADSNAVYVVNVKGLGTRLGQPATTSWQIGAFLGTANKIPVPGSEALSKYTAQVFEDGRVPQIKQTQLMLRAGQPPVPVPARVGEPSVFQHVLYILKENKTYDQMFGDLSQGNGNPSLCIYPRLVSPNHHTLAEQYVLLDNFYCNGVNSADGHSWSTEANVTDHLEKSFGGFSRSYTFGDDPLTYSSTGFIWNNVLQHGLTFRNYGEMDYASTSPAKTWAEIYQDYTNGTGAIRYVQNIGVASLRPYSSTNVPGWNMGIPDVVRADGFIKELNAAQSNGVWAAFHLLYLPNDHTGGPPTPRAQVADNDLALGRVVEAVTKSVFGSNTVIFVIEDDPQSGYDHVDAHRSICLVISPYTKRGQVISTFLNQAGVLHTMERILGLPPMNQQDAMAPLMFDCFTNVPNFAPYTALPNNIPLDEGVALATTAPSRQQRYWAKQLEKMDFTRPDRIDDDLFNRYIWWTIKGDEPFPARFVGGHGRGLKQLGLVLDPIQGDDDDDD